MRVQDLQTADQSLWARYIQCFASGDYTSALKILSDKQLDGKKMTADVYNAAGSNISTLQDGYSAEVTDVLVGHITAFNQLIASLIDKQAYSSTTVYTKGNFVIYNNAVYVYINNVDSSGNAPTNTAYWLYLGLRGNTGVYSLDMALKYAWAQNVQYSKYDVVTYGDVLWFANKDNINSTPSKSDTTWGVLYDIPTARIYTTEQEPTNKYAGLLWWQQTEA